MLLNACQFKSQESFLSAWFYNPEEELEKPESTKYQHRIILVFSTNNVGTTVDPHARKMNLDFSCHVRHKS